MEKKFIEEKLIVCEFFCKIFKFELASLLGLYCLVRCFCEVSISTWPTRRAGPRPSLDNEHARGCEDKAVQSRRIILGL